MGWWTNLQQRCQTCSRVTLGAGVLLLTIVIGAVMLTAGAAGLAWTNTETFCIGCHEMKDNVYAEFKGTIHDVNRSGVRAICSNCHVPHEPWPLIKRKMRASFELWGHFTGVIDTKEKFEKKGYRVLDVFRPVFWNEPKVQWWYKQNMFLIVHPSVDTTEIERRANCMSSDQLLIHPELYYERILEFEKKSLDFQRLSAGEGGNFNLYLKLLFRSFKKSLGR